MLFLIVEASSTVLPLSHSVASDDDAIAEPQPNVLNLASSIRFGLGRLTTKEEVDYVADKLANVVTRLREMSPLYELAKEGVDLSTMQWQTD